MPFSQDQFFEVFEAYNVAVWPAQLFFYLLALVAIALAGLGVRNSRALVMAIIGFLWLWAGVAYHFVFFSRINPAAWLFGALFLVEGALLIWNGVAQRRLALERPKGWSGWVGGSLIVYALIAYPLLGLAAGHARLQLPVLGVPCPTTILTIGLLFWAGAPWRRTLLAIPLSWAAIGTTAAFSLGVPQDFGLPAAGVAGVLLFLPRSLARSSHAGVRQPLEAPQ